MGYFYFFNLFRIVVEIESMVFYRLRIRWEAKTGKENINDWGNWGDGHSSTPYRGENKWYTTPLLRRVQIKRIQISKFFQYQ